MLQKRKQFRTRQSSLKGRRRHNYPVEYKLKAVKMHLEDGASQVIIAQQMGVCQTAMARWVRQYRSGGVAAMATKSRPGSGAKLPSAVKDRIVAMKRSEPHDGTHRISDLLKRVFFMKASHETVRRVLHSESLLAPTIKPKPRAKRTASNTAPQDEGGSYVKGPHLMWQSDISVISWKKQSVYLIGFMDDYSRFVTGLGLYMQQKADNVLEVFRRAVAEHKAPAEMLTDNGRQYTSWRGQAQFEKEMVRMQIRHIRSQPHHPQTQGKIERFWKTIKEELFARTLFDGFEDMQNRTRLWIQYYNFKRPHQGIGGLCPADRFYEVSHDVRQVVESGIAANVLQMALLGVPRKPCYLVGRMDDQSVTVMAERGCLKLQVTDLVTHKTQEMIYPLSTEPAETDITEGEIPYGKVERDDEKQAQRISIVDGNGQMPGGVVGVDGEAQALGNLQGVGGEMDDPHALAESGYGRDASGAGAEEKSEEGRSLESATSDNVGAAGKESASSIGLEIGQSSGNAAGEHSGKNGTETSGEHENSAEGVDHVGRTGTETGEDYHAGPWGRDNGRGGCEPAGGLPENLLRMGEERACGDDECAGGQGCRPPADASGRPGEGSPEEKTGRDAKRTLRCPGVDVCPACSGHVRSEVCRGCQAQR
jgi:transposase InsO family protein/transposase-like protein